MKRHPALQLTVEEFDEWVATTGRFEEVARAAQDAAVSPQAEARESFPALLDALSDSRSE